jgi:hypothetical protein
MRHLPSALIAAAILLAPLVWHLAGALAPPPPPGRGEEVAALRETVARLEAELAALEGRVDGLDARTALTRTAEPDAPALPPAQDGLRDAFAQVVLIADRRSVNDGLTVARPADLEALFGLPREDLTDECQVATNETLRGLLELGEAGPIRVRLQRPALVSLRQVFANVQLYEPELYARIRSAGSLCVRRIRGAQTAASSHAYGLAVDINIDGHLDTLGDGKTQLGLTLLADFFRKEGWIWGAGFGREDSMHFEVSLEKLEQWRRLGRI